MGGLISRGSSLDTTQFDIIDVQPADPAVGSTFAYTCPDNVRLLLLFARFDYNTDGTGSTRQLMLDLTDSGGNILDSIYSPQSLGAVSPNYTFMFTSGTILSYAASLARRSYIPMSRNMFMHPGEILTLTVATAGAGDVNDEISLRFKRWVNP